MDHPLGRPLPVLIMHGHFTDGVLNDSELPWNIEVDVFPDDYYGVPYASVFHRELGCDDTAIFSLLTGDIIAGELPDDDERQAMSRWVADNLERLLSIWHGGQGAMIVKAGEPYVL